MKVKFAAAAERELQELEAYIAQDDPAAARRTVEDIVHSCLALAHAPERGKAIAKKRGVTLRRLVRGSYLVVYSTIDDLVVIHRVRHGARSPRLLLKDLDLS